MYVCEDVYVFVCVCLCVCTRTSVQNPRTADAIIFRKLLRYMHVSCFVCRCVMKRRGECACVRACVCVCVRVCLSVCVRTYLPSVHSTMLLTRCGVVCVCVPPPRRVCVQGSIRHRKTTDLWYGRRRRLRSTGSKNMCMNVCICVCGCVGVGVCVRACVHVR